MIFLKWLLLLPWNKYDALRLAIKNILAAAQKRVSHPNHHQPAAIKPGATEYTQMANLVKVGGVTAS